MEVEESLGSTQLKQILDSFEAGDVLPEVCTPIAIKLQLVI